MSTDAEPEETSAPRDMSPVVPDTYFGVFRSRLCGGNSSDYPLTPFQVTLKIDEIEFTEYTFDRFPLGVATAHQIFQDECAAYYTTDLDIPDNETALDDLLNQLAQDFFLWRTFSVDFVYQGLNAVQPNALIDCIEFSYVLDEPDEDDDTIEAVIQRLRPSCFTRVQSEPWTGYPEQFQHWDSGGYEDSCENSYDRSPGILMLGPAGSPNKFTGVVLTLEDGRLRAVYDGSYNPACGCSVCLPLCATATRCGNTTPQSGFTITASYFPVTSVTVTNGGHSYTSAPTVGFSTSNGIGATATAVIIGNAVSSVAVLTGGVYAAPPTVVLSGGGGTAAAATAVLGSLVTVGSCVTDGLIVSVTRTNAGSGYTSAPTCTIVGDGMGATVIANMVATVASFTVANPGSGYTSAPTISVVPVGATGRVILTATTVDHVNVVTSGSYATAASVPAIGFSTPIGWSGSGATAFSAMTMTSASLTATGTGYTVGDLVTVSGGTATIAGIFLVTSVDGGGGISTFSINTAGRYTAYPALSTPVTGGTGTGATFSIQWKLLDITVSNGGTNYTNAPNISIGGFGGATAQAFLTPTTISSVTLLSSGSGYLVPPTVTLSGGGGSGGLITAVLNPFTIGSFTVTAGGTGYTTATMTVTGSGGSGGAGTPVINARCCIDGITQPGTYILSSPDPSCVTNGKAAWTCNTGGGGTLQRAINASLPFTYCGGNTNFSPVPNTGVVITGPGSFHLNSTIGFGVNAISFCVGLPGNYHVRIINSSCFEDPDSVNPSGISVSSSPCTQTLSPVALVSKKYTGIVRVRGCAITTPAPVLPGATVTATGPGYSQTATTDTSGIATFLNMPAVCPYTFTISKSRFVTQTVNIQGSCQNSTTSSLLFEISSMVPVSGYTCCYPWIDPIPITLLADDSNGTTTINLHTLAGRWFGCYTFHDSNLACYDLVLGQTCAGQVAGPPAHVLTPASGTVSVGFLFSCGSTVPTDPSLTVFNPVCSAPGFTPSYYVTAGWCNGDLYYPSQGIGCGTPPSVAQVDLGSPYPVTFNPPAVLTGGLFTIPVNLTFTTVDPSLRPGGTVNIHE